MRLTATECSGALAPALERSILRRTAGRIHQLRVEQVSDRIWIHGLTPTYYVKQLAIQGVIEALGNQRPPMIHWDIDVVNSTPRPN